MFDLKILTMKILQTLYFVFFVIFQSIGQSDSTGFKKEKLGIGLHTGFYNLRTDIPSESFENPGFGIYVRVPVARVLDIKLNYTRSVSKGMDVQPWFHPSVLDPFIRGLSEAVYAPYENVEQGWFPSYKATISSFEILGQLQFLRRIKNDFPFGDKLDLYLFGGMGFVNFHTRLDLLDKDNQPYLNLVDRINWTPDKFDTQVGRQEIKKSIESIYDHKYETDGPTDDHGTEVSIVFGAGLSYAVAKNIKLGLEYKTMGFSGMKYVDGTNSDFSGYKESVSATYFQFTVEYFLR